ncbi:Stimulated by retinoic acid gene 6 protein-like [Merluccius polli]|uniref:Stimulated by retinoic acid gene 6 protein-like n=1 Tax=Merluccius polli TaxID=89951 RepID=A0AA47NXG6_MERPO|nr:Stimulated by retinoic acid gene 6 protein-like [Merluccius polli]
MALGCSPLEAMGSLSNRWSYGFAFGATSHVVLMQFFEKFIIFSAPSWAQSFVFLLGAFELGLIFFPFFACLSTPARGVGASLGILYTLAWLYLMLTSIISCPHTEGLAVYEVNVMVSWPTILSFLFLLGRYVLILVKVVHRHPQHEVPGDEIQHLVQHVKRLLQKPPPPSSDSWFKRRVYRWDPHFRFPNRLLGTTIICLIGLYTMVMVMNMYVVKIFIFLENFEWLNEYTSLGRKSWLIASITAGLTSLVYIFHVLVCYRKHMKRLWMGQRGFLPDRLHLNINPASSMAAIARYSGCQIAYTLWGYTITHLVHFMVLMIFVCLIIIPIRRGQILETLSTIGEAL